MPRNGPKRSPEAHQSILDATRELLGSNGPSNVSINEIAALAKVGRATIYRWWPSKAAVVIEALEQWCEGENPPPETGSTRQNLELQLERVAEMFASPIGSAIRELIAESQGDPEVATEFRRRFFDIREERALATIRAGVASGELRPDLDPETIVDMLYGPLWLRLLVEHRPLTRTHTQRILGQAWPALCAPSAEPAAKT